jgi:hypothetical protein
VDGGSCVARQTPSRPGQPDAVARAAVRFTALLNPVTSTRCSTLPVFKSPTRKSRSLTFTSTVRPVDRERRICCRTVRFADLLRLRIGDAGWDSTWRGRRAPRGRRPCCEPLRLDGVTTSPTHHRRHSRCPSTGNAATAVSVMAMRSTLRQFLLQVAFAHEVDAEELLRRRSTAVSSPIARALDVAGFPAALGCLDAFDERMTLVHVETRTPAPPTR